MQQIYRIENETEILHSEVCRTCAAKAKEDGVQVTYDMYLSERYACEIENDYCEICEESFFVDGRKFKRGDMKTDSDFIC